jgi:hypothetical protein
MIAPSLSQAAGFHSVGFHDRRGGRQTLLHLLRQLLMF